MVSFETEIYNRQEDDVIGIKVIVVADNGQTIDTIHCVNETDFNELKAKLDVLNEDYVQFNDGSTIAGLTIENILANASEIVNINATKLGGYQSDAFSKTGHTHAKSSITDLYNYDISLSNYNLNLANNQSTTVTVKVTNMSNSPVNNHNVVLYKNGSVWKTGRTNSNGVFTAVYSPETEGLITFSVNNQKVQCFVDASEVWKEVTMTTSRGFTPGEMKLLINESLQLAKLIITNTSANFKFSISSPAYDAAIPEQYRPVNQVLSGTVFHKGRIIISSAGSIYFTTIDGDDYNNKNASCTLLWAY